MQTFWCHSFSPPCRSQVLESGQSCKPRLTTFTCSSLHQTKEPTPLQKDPRSRPIVLTTSTWLFQGDNGVGSSWQGAAEEPDHRQQAGTQFQFALVPNSKNSEVTHPERSAKSRIYFAVQMACFLLRACFGGLRRGAAGGRC